MVSTTKASVPTAKPAGISRLDVLFDGTFMDRLGALIFGAGAGAGAIAASGATEGVGLEIAADVVGTTIFDAALGSSAAAASGVEIAGVAAAHAAEHSGGFFRNIFRFSSEFATDYFIDSLLWGSGMRSSHHSEPADLGDILKNANTRKLSPDEIKAFLNHLQSREMQPLGGAAAESIMGIGFLREQLHIYANNPKTRADQKPEMQALSQYFNNLDLKLPDPEKVKKAYKLLSNYLHPDHRSDLEQALMTQLNIAKDNLLHPAKRADYESLLKSRPEFWESLKQTIDHLAAANWKHAFEQTINSFKDVTLLTAREGIEAPRPDTVIGRMQHDFAHASQTKQGGIVFGTVTGVAGATYFGTKALEEYLQLKHQRKKPNEKQTAHWRNVVLYGATALGSAGLTGAALNGYRLQGGAVR